MTYPLVTDEKVEYQRHWEHNSQHFQSQGCYDWMAEQLRPLAPKRILDIGCGTGQGVAALCKAFDPQILSLEENAACIKTAERTLAAAGHPATSYFRIGYEEHADGTHDMVFDQTELAVTDRIALVHADVLLDDPVIESLLAKVAPFDAVTIWLTGTYMMRQSCRNIAAMQLTDTIRYRLMLQNRIYKIADTVLRPGGWLQVVDRSETPDSELLREDFMAAHREQASLGSLEVFDLSYTPYTEPKDWGVRMVMNPGKSGRQPNMSSISMTSILSRKP